MNQNQATIQSMCEVYTKKVLKTNISKYKPALRLGRRDNNMTHRSLFASHQAYRCLRDLKMYYVSMT